MGLGKKVVRSSALLLTLLASVAYAPASLVRADSDGTVLCARHEQARFDAASRFLVDASSLSVVLVQQVAAFVFSLVLFVGSVVVADPRSIWGVSGTAWLSALGAGTLYYAVAFWFYVTGLRGVRPAFD